jgi:drug/metabolite transporter (DMT)-like permease
LTRGDAVRVVAAGLLVVLGYHLFLNVGKRHTTSGVAALVVALAPALLVVGGIALAQRGLPWRWDSVRPWRSAPSRSGS